MDITSSTRRVDLRLCSATPPVRRQETTGGGENSLFFILSVHLWIDLPDLIRSPSLTCGLGLIMVDWLESGLPLSHVQFDIYTFIHALHYSQRASLNFLVHDWIIGQIQDSNPQ